MKFEDIIPASERIAPGAGFAEARALISTAKSWRKWSKTVSRPFYERICTEAREAVAAFGLDESDADRFIRNVIDHYIDCGTFNPDCNIFNWELGLFALFKRRIDEAVGRRCRAMLAARLRKASRGASQPDHPQSPAGRDARTARPQPPCNPQQTTDRQHANSASKSADCGCGRAGGASLQAAESTRSAPDSYNSYDSYPKAAPQSPPAGSPKSAARKPLPGGKIGRKWRREARKARVAALFRP